MNKLPWTGLVLLRKICNIIGLPDICYNTIDKKKIKEMILWHHYKELKEEMAPLKKLKIIINDDMRYPQNFLKTIIT